MKFVFVLEDDPRFKTDIWEAIQAIDPQIQVRYFDKLSLFFDWLKDLNVNGPLAIGRGGVKYPEDKGSVGNEEHQLAAVISKVEFLGARQLPLLKKTRDLFVAKRVCTLEDPTAFVLTTFMAENLDIRALENRLLNNVILKPFDRLILIQHLTFAIDGRHPASKYTIANQKTSTLIEMLKQIDMKAIGEIGFVSKSDVKIEAGTGISKYYSDFFKGELKNSVHARPWQTLKESDEDFKCFFYYYALNPAQISLLRRKVRSGPNEKKWNWNLAPANQNLSKRPLGVVMIEENDASAAEISDMLRKRISNIELIVYKSYIAFCEDFDPSLLGDAGREEPPRAFPKDVDLTFVFDHSGQVLQSVEKNVKEPVQIMGVAEKVFEENKHWWIQNLTPDMANRWKEAVASRSQTTIVFILGLNKFYLKPIFFDKDPGHKFYKIKMAELTAQERDDYKRSLSKMPKITDLILMSHRYIGPEQIEKWQNIADRVALRSKANGSMERPQLIVLSSKEYQDKEIREFGKFAADIFFRPIDRVYTLQKLKLLFPEISFGKDPVDFHTVNAESSIYAANPVVITEISEAGLVMQYYRALELGCFREFVLWQAYELDLAKIVGTCNFTEPGAEKGVFNNHFVFFAIGDNFLKSIRIWIRDNYILSKETPQ